MIFIKLFTLHFLPAYVLILYSPELLHFKEMRPFTHKLIGRYSVQSSVSQKFASVYTVYDYFIIYYFIILKCFLSIIEFNNF